MVGRLRGLGAVPPRYGGIGPAVGIVGHGRAHGQGRDVAGERGWARPSGRDANAERIEEPRTTPARLRSNSLRLDQASLLTRPSAVPSVTGAVSLGEMSPRDGDEPRGAAGSDVPGRAARGWPPRGP